MISSILVSSVTVSASTGLETASAKQIETINPSLVAHAPIDKVWNVVADMDKEPRYWSSIKEIKNIIAQTKIDVLWKMDLSGIPIFGKGSSRTTFSRQLRKH